MNSEEIKEQITMPEVMAKYGITIRNNMCKCPFHGIDKHPSMKVFRDGANCFTCGWNGDIFKLVQDMEQCDFKTAFKVLGGTYKEHSNKATRLLSERRFKAQKEAREREERDNQKLKKEILFALDILQTTIQVYEPFSDTWCEAQNELPQLYEAFGDILNGRGVNSIELLNKCQIVRDRFLNV